METVKNNEWKNTDSKTLALGAAGTLLEKKALDVAVYSVRDLTSVTDYYVNATGRSATQVGALADAVEEALGLRGRDALRVEGRSGGAWILVDYGDVIVNILDRPSREIYPLDRLFPAECTVDLKDLVAEVDRKFAVDQKQ